MVLTRGLISSIYLVRLRFVYESLQITMSFLTVSASLRLLNPLRILSSRNGQHLCFQCLHNSSNQRAFDYLLVLDFEATCDKEGQLYPQVGIGHELFQICVSEAEYLLQEIIEFPVLKVDTKCFNIQSQFHRYVKPEIHPELSSFCSNLTGIIQVSH